ncbi:MAG: Hsp70 family protein [Phycisphaerales bacterium]|nr:Hsp70 family protein [Phycisphaerales bacterium]
MPAPDNLIVGIDLGTTNSLVAVCDERGPRALPDPANGSVLLPSVVRLEPLAGGGFRPVVGEDAKRLAPDYPASTFSSVKRLMGRSIDDAAGDIPYLPYRIARGDQDTVRVVVETPSGPRLVSPQEISAHVLRALKERAETALGVEVRRAVVTVPAYFDDAQRQATRDAGRLAGLEVVRIINEPTAAALAYGLGLERESVRNTGPQLVAVYDLGGGTFDISILKLSDSAAAPAGTGDSAGTRFFQVLSTAGDTHLGGDDVDRVLVDFALGRAGRTRDRLSPGDLGRLTAAAESAKRLLSDADAADISTALDDGSELACSISRADFEQLIAAWVERTIACCRRAITDATRRLNAAQAPAVDSVVMVGGSSRIPLVRRRVAEFFGVEPYTAIDPDQVVALGASVQASILSGATRGQLLLDVIPLSLGVETVGGAVAKLIMRNSTVPTRATEMFSTSVDGQTSIKIHILQGEREMVDDCRSLGVFHVRGIPPMPAGIPQLQVEFLVDSNGVLSVSAVEKRSGRRAAVQVIPNHGLTRDEVERIERESVVHAREDMQRHRVVDLIVNCKLDLKWIGERLERLKDQVEPAYGQRLRGGMAALSAMVQAAEADWRAVDANLMHELKEQLDRESIRLQELSIAESLRSEPPRR